MNYKKIRKKTLEATKLAHNIVSEGMALIVVFTSYSYDGDERELKTLTEKVIKNLETHTETLKKLIE